MASFGKIIPAVVLAGPMDRVQSFENLWTPTFKFSKVRLRSWSIDS